METKIINKKYKLRKNYDQINNKRYILYENKILPVEVYITKSQKKKVVYKKLSKKEALKLAISKGESEIKNKLSKGEYIIDKNTLNFYVEDSKIVVDIFFKVYENITDYEYIMKGENNDT